MKRCIACLIMFTCVSIALTISCMAGEKAGPLVSTKWLRENIGTPELTIVDIRKVEEYKDGHIPEAISLTYTAWRTVEKNLGCQLPFWDDLEETVCSLGLSESSRVIIAGRSSTDEDLVNTTRVAWTLKYTGLKNLSVLDGGYEKWLNDHNPVSSQTKKTSKGSFKCRPDNSILATRKDVNCSRTGTAAIVDTRPSAQYTGETICKTVKKKGHIPGAVNLPYSLVFTKQGGFEKKERLQEIVSGHIGNDRNREIIILCTDGHYASAWWFVMSEILAYKNVRIYDGSMEDWCCDETSPLATEPANQR
jgi:thiosulfate/3-mercaptopyruvate sulfurtransferase